jgi:hypothetical protein
MQIQTLRCYHSRFRLYGDPFFVSAKRGKTIAAGSGAACNLVTGANCLSSPSTVRRQQATVLVLKSNPGRGQLAGDSAS